MAIDLVFLGPPGSGKGTQGERLAQKLSVPRLSTGDLLREAVAEGTELGRRAEPIIEAGRLVPDEIVLGLVRERAGNEVCARGMLLDGFPRTVAQAQGLDEILSDLHRAVRAVIYVAVTDEEIVARLSGRLTCPQCGAVYHVRADPPAEAGLCDGCGAALTQRADDREDAVRERLRVYHAQTEPLVDLYRSWGLLHTVDGAQSMEEVEAQIAEVVEDLGEAVGQRP